MIQYVGFCDWLFSLNTNFSRFTLPCYKMYQYFIFSYGWKIFHCMDRPHYLSVEGHLDCFHFLAVMNNTAMNIWVHVFVSCVFIFLGYMPREWIAGSYDNSIFNILKICQNFLQWLHNFAFLQAICKDSNFSIFLSTLVIFFWPS